MAVVQDVLDSCKQIEEIHRRKNDDYATTDNPFSNFDVAEYGLNLFPRPHDQVFVWPIFTKLARLAVLLNRDRSPNNESIEDSFIDIATYILLWKARWKERMIRLQGSFVTTTNFADLPPQTFIMPSKYACVLHSIIDCAQCQREDNNFTHLD